jgi:hypothetical protein
LHQQWQYQPQYFRMTAVKFSFNFYPDNVLIAEILQLFIAFPHWLLVGQDYQNVFLPNPCKCIFKSISQIQGMESLVREHQMSLGKLHIQCRCWNEVSWSQLNQFGSGQQHHILQLSPAHKGTIKATTLFNTKENWDTSFRWCFSTTSINNERFHKALYIQRLEYIHTEFWKGTIVEMQWWFSFIRMQKLLMWNAPLASETFQMLH